MAKEQLAATIAIPGSTGKPFGGVWGSAPSMQTSALADKDTLRPPAGGIPHPSPAGDTFPKGEGWGCSLGASACYAVHIGGMKSYLYPQSQRPKPSPLGKVAERSEDG